LDFDYIDSDEGLREFCAAVRNDRSCALDTEFVREKTYYPLLALIQIATDSRQACIDPLAVKDFSPLVELFENPDMVKILHASGQDLELFHHVFGAIPRPLFDTQIAAAVLGYANQIWSSRSAACSWTRNTPVPTGPNGPSPRASWTMPWTTCAT